MTLALAIPETNLEPAAAPPAAAGPGIIPWPRALDLFLDSRADSPHTRRSYRRHVEAAMTALDVFALADVDGSMLAEWRSHVVASPLATASQSQALAALRSFLRWSRALGLHRLSDDVIRETLRTPRAVVCRPYQVLSDPEVVRLLEVAHTMRDLRDRRGLPRRRPTSSRARHPRRHRPTRGRAGGDGRPRPQRQGPPRPRRTDPRRGRPPPPPLRRLHRPHTGERRAATPIDRPSTPPAGRQAVNARCRVPDRPAVRARRYRCEEDQPAQPAHSYAIRALRGGASVVAVQKLLGHANVATTSRYLDHLELDELRAAVPALPLG